jgi:hypothetical protein
MKKRLRRYVILISILTVNGFDVPLACAETRAPEGKLTVRVYNYALVPGALRAQAEQETAGIFQRAGNTLAWIDCPVSPEEIDKFPACTQDARYPVGTLKILPKIMAGRFGLPPSHRGVTFKDHASYVFYHRVQELSHQSGLSEPVVLGHIIAHELGHLLLGKGAHLEYGIMKEDLRVNDFREAEKGRPLTFSPKQALRMRMRLQKQTIKK